LTFFSKLFIFLLYTYAKRVTLFGDNLNIINVSGIVVVFLGVFLYKVTHYMSAEKESNINDEKDLSYFSSISQVDGSDIFVYEDDDNSPRRAKRLQRVKLSDPDLALSFRIDDEDFSDEEVVKNIDGSSPLRGRINGSAHGSLELDKRENEIEVV
jgi:hypothetical protein